MPEEPTGLNRLNPYRPSCIAHMVQPASWHPVRGDRAGATETTSRKPLARSLVGLTGGPRSAGTGPVDARSQPRAAHQKHACEQAIFPDDPAATSITQAAGT